MGYNIDLTQMSIFHLKSKLVEGYLVPSRRILLDDIDQVFEKLVLSETNSVAELIFLLKTKKKLENFALENNIDLNYLNILNREIKSYISKPVQLKDIPYVNADIINSLGKFNINNSIQLWEKCYLKKERESLSKELGISLNELNRLTCLSDLCRIRWINHTFAQVLYYLGYKTVEMVAKTNGETLYNMIKNANKNHELFKGNIGLNDMNLCVQIAKDLPMELEI